MTFSHPQAVNFPDSVRNMEAVSTCFVKGLLSSHAAGPWVLQKLSLGIWDVQSLGSHLLSLPWMVLGQ